jgi:hypothetical protein
LMFMESLFIVQYQIDGLLKSRCRPPLNGNRAHCKTC